MAASVGKQAGLEKRSQITEHLWMIYVLALPRFDTEVSQALVAFRQMHEPERADLVAPHVTLVFGVRKSSPEDIVAICEKLALETPVIATDFSRHVLSYDPFERVHKISLQCDRGAAVLTTLHDRLYDGPHRDEFDRKVPYQPHMTIGANESLAVLEPADVMSIGVFPITAEINRLRIVERVGNTLRTVKDLNLIG